MDQSSQLSRLEAGADGGAVGEGRARGALWWDEDAGDGSRSFVCTTRSWQNVR